MENSPLASGCWTSKEMFMKRVLFGMIAVVFGFSCALGLGEVVLRLLKPQMTGPIQYAFDQELGPIPVPNQSARRVLPGNYDYRYTNNSLGLRGSREYSFSQSTTERVLVLGDSFTYGLGVDDDQTFAARIESRLIAAEKPVEVINAGSPGKGTDYALKFFDTVGRKFSPTLTVLCFFRNDFDDNVRGAYYTIDVQMHLQPKSLRSSMASQKQILSKIPLYNWLISWSHLANLLKQAAISMLTVGDEAGSTSKNDSLVTRYSRERSSLPVQHQFATSIYLHHLNQSVQNSQSALLVFYIPDADDVESYRSNKSMAEEERVLTELLEKESVAFISLTSFLADSQTLISQLYYNEGHWTAVAHQLAAKAIADAVSLRLKNVKRRVSSADGAKSS